MHILKDIPQDLDQFDGDILVTVVAVDERPLKGCNSWIDWRLYGTLSSLIAKSYFTGALGEKLLIPTYGKFRFDRLILVGGGYLNNIEANTGDWEATLKIVRSTVEALKAQRIGLALPRMPVFERESSLLRQINESHLPLQTSVFLPRGLIHRFA